MNHIRRTRKVNIITRTCLIVLMMFCLGVFSSTVEKLAAQEIDEKKAAKIKAGILFHLAKLVTWPKHKFESSGDRLLVLFLGDDPYGMGGYFESQTPSLIVGGHQIAVKRVPFDRAVSIDSAFRNILKRSHILFVASSYQVPVADLLDLTVHNAVLTVGETEEFTRQGGMVGFGAESGRIKIFVNLNAVQREDIEIGAQFLQHAAIVESVE